MFEFLNELDILLQDFISFCKKYIKRHNKLNFIKFKRRVLILIKKKKVNNWVFYNILLKKWIFTRKLVLFCLKTILKYLIYFNRYYKRFYFFIFLLNILNKEYYQSHFADFSRELANLFLRVILKYITEFELKFIQAKIHFYKKKTMYNFFRFFRNLRFKIFFIFFYLFNLFNIIILRNFIINTPFDASLPTDRGEYYTGVRRFGFFPRIFWTFMETVMIHVRPFRKYIDTFNLMCLNLRGLHGMFYYYIILDFIVFFKNVIGLLYRTAYLIKQSIYALVQFLVEILDINFYYYSFKCIFDWVFYWYMSCWEYFYKFIFNILIYPWLPLFYILRKLIYFFPFLFFINYCEYILRNFIFLISKICVVLIIFIFIIILIKFNILKLFLSIIICYYIIQYIKLIRRIKYVEKFFILFIGRENLSMFYLSFYYNFLNEIRYLYKLPDPVYYYFILRIQKKFYTTSIIFLNSELINFFDIKEFISGTCLLNVFRLKLDLMRCSDSRFVCLLIYLGVVIRLQKLKLIGFIEMQSLLNEGWNIFDLVSGSKFGEERYILNYQKCNDFLRRRDYRLLFLCNNYELMYILMEFYLAEQLGDFFFLRMV
jgi:hypothetical protein